MRGEAAIASADKRLRRSLGFDDLGCARTGASASSSIEAARGGAWEEGSGSGAAGAVRRHGGHLLIPRSGRDDQAAAQPARPPSAERWYGGSLAMGKPGEAARGPALEIGRASV